MGVEIGIGALLGAACISAVGNLVGAGISAAGAASMNEDTMNFNREEAAKARQFQKDMYQQQLIDQQMLYEKYQSPEALVRQFGQAGVNSAAVLGSGKGGFSGALPSVPSAPSGSAASISGLSNPLEYFADALKGSTSDSVSVLNAITDKNLKDKQALKVLAEKANLEVQNGILKWQDMINNTVGSEKAKQELNSIVEQVGLLSAQKNYAQAQKLVADTIQRLNDKDFDIKDEELSQLKLRGTFLEADLNNSLEYQRETIKTEKSKQQSNYATARQQNALAKISEIQGDIDAKTKVQKLKSLQQQLIRDNILSQSEQREFSIKMSRLQDLMDARDYDGSVGFVDDLLQYLKETVSIFK